MMHIKILQADQCGQAAVTDLRQICHVAQTEFLQQRQVRKTVGLIDNAYRIGI